MEILVWETLFMVTCMYKKMVSEKRTLQAQVSIHMFFYVSAFFFRKCQYLTVGTRHPIFRNAKSDNIWGRVQQWLSWITYIAQKPSVQLLHSTEVSWNHCVAAESYRFVFLDIFHSFETFLPDLGYSYSVFVFENR